MSLTIEAPIARWLDVHAGEILEVQAVLSQALPDEPGKLDLMLREVDSWYERMNSLYADALTFQDQAKRRALISRDQQKITDLDREIVMRAETTDERRLVHTLEGIVEAVKSRLMLGMSMRRSFVSEGHAGHRTET